MKIVLLKNIDHLGKQWEVRSVSDGYARNVLIPQKLAEPATKNAVERAEKARKKMREMAEESLKQAQELASAIDGYELTIRVRANDAGDLYATIGPRQIIEALERERFTVPLKAIRLADPIKRIGEYHVPVVLDHGLEVHNKVIVEAIKEEEIA